MKKALFISMVVISLLSFMSSKTNGNEQKTKDNDSEVMTMGFENSGSPKSFEDVWVD